MNRFHVHLNVHDLSASIRFYRELFASEPSVVKPDYAKWMLDDPRINFAISTGDGQSGVSHLGLQVDSAGELTALGARLDAAGGSLLPEADVVCCYARSDKVWTEDPQGIRWETFHTLGEATTYHGVAASEHAGGDCSPTAMPPVTEASQGGCCAPRSACC